MVITITEHNVQTIVGELADNLSLAHYNEESLREELAETRDELSKLRDLNATRTKHIGSLQHKLDERNALIRKVSSIVSTVIDTLPNDLHAISPVLDENDLRDALLSIANVIDEDWTGQ